MVELQFLEKVYLCEKVFFFFYDLKDMLFFLRNQIDSILTAHSCTRHFKIYSIFTSINLTSAESAKVP